MEIIGGNEKGIADSLTYNNFNRTLKLAWILFIANFIFLFIDYNNWRNLLWIGTPGYRLLFYTHVALGLGALFGILGFYKLKISSQYGVTWLHKLYIILFTLFILSLSAIISGWVDQKIHGQITIYIMACFTIAVLYHQRPGISAVLYGFSYVAFMLLLTLSQKDPIIRQGHYVNAALLVVIAYFLSNVLYKLMKRDLNHMYSLETLVAERTKELQDANELLKREMAERQKSDEKIARLDRLNLVGEMAACICHEVRNPMTTVKGFLQLIRDKQAVQDREHFDLMISEVDRANEILSEFLSISRNKATTFERSNLNDIVRFILPLIQADAHNNDICLTVELNDVPELNLNVMEIRQVILNLVRNGFEAMPDGGKLSIRTSVAGNEVALAVSDEGSGMEQYVLDKLGTPFFTTKKDGTGLGLAVCEGIVARHKGRLRAETGDQGSTFYVYFNLDVEDTA